MFNLIDKEKIMRKRNTSDLPFEDPKTDNDCCFMCGKEVNPETCKMVHLIDGGSNILHPEDEDKYEEDSGDLYFHYVGSECLKKIGKEWVS